MNNRTKRKVRRSWGLGWVLGLGLLSSLGGGVLVGKNQLSITRLQEVRPASQALEILKTSSSKSERRKAMLQLIQRLYEAPSLSLKLEQSQSQLQSLEQSQLQSRSLSRSQLQLQSRLLQLQSLERSRPSIQLEFQPLSLELSRSLEQSLEQSQPLSQKLAQKLVPLLEPSQLQPLSLEQSQSQSLEQLLEQLQLLEQSLSLEQSQSQSLDLSQLLKQSQEVETSLIETFELLLETKYQQKLLSGEELQQALNVAEGSNQNLTLLGVLAVSTLICLLLLLRLCSQISMPLTHQLICFLPEECVAELGVLHQRLQSQKRSELLIRLLLFYCVIELFWVFYISIQIDNLWLPGSKKIDD